MKSDVYRFTLARVVDLIEAESTLQLAILATEGLLGEACVRMETSYHIDAPRCAVLIDGGTPAGNAVVRIFTAFITREFGADAFSVRRVARPVRRAEVPVGAAA